MSEPRRWLEDPSTNAALLRVLKAAGAPPRLPPGVHASVGEYAAKLATQGMLAKVGGTSALHALLATGGKVATALALAGAASLGVYAYRHAESDSTRVVPVGSALDAPPEPAKRIQVPTVTDQAEEPSRLPGEAATSSARRRTLPDSAGPRQIGSAETPAIATDVSAPSLPPAPSLPAEAKLLDTARAFLGDSPALALELTDRHQRAYPDGQLGAEREFIAIAALLALGRRQEAEHRAAPALARAPGSLYARRLRGLLDGKK